MKEGNRLSDISAAIQQSVESEGFSVIRQFVGHGIGRALHEEPQVPNFGRSGARAEDPAGDDAGHRADDRGRGARGRDPR